MTRQATHPDRDTAIRNLIVEAIKQAKRGAQRTNEPLHPYIAQALDAARAGDLDALAWLELDCYAWQLLPVYTQAALLIEMHRPARKNRTGSPRTNGTHVGRGNYHPAPNT